MTDTVLPAEVLTKPLSHAGRSREQYARGLCFRHAPALFTMASVILDDVDLAGEIVAAAIAVACSDPPEKDSGQMRVRLARSVYRRCLGNLAFTERYPQLARPGLAGRPWTVFDDLTTGQRAMVALAVFGAHGLAETAVTMQRPADDVAEQLRRVALRHDGD